MPAIPRPTRNAFCLHAPFQPAGDQPQAIEALLRGLQEGLAYQTLLGVTGSGKTFTMAHVIAHCQRPTLILAPNKTLAAQLYAEMRQFFPENAVEYFVSYYDYYQPEAYVPASDTYIEKDAAINSHIERLRLSATRALFERNDVILVATVSAIYGLGDPEAYADMLLPIRTGQVVPMRDILRKLNELQYARNDMECMPGSYRVRGDTVDIFPAESDQILIRVQWFDETIESIQTRDPLLGHVLAPHLQQITVYPKSHYVTPREKVLQAVDRIKSELADRLRELEQAGKLLEAQRLRERTRYDIEMLLQMGYCTGIENYSRLLTGRGPGEPPPTLLDYFPQNSLLFLDESHVMIPQLGAMYRGDAARKTNLVEYGFRLPSARDNRPLRFEEFLERAPVSIFVSATPGPFEHAHAGQWVEQVIRPTGLLDPNVLCYPADHQVEHLLGAIEERVSQKERVLVTTLTKKMAEHLTEYYTEKGLKVRYLHSDIDTVERVALIRDLRLGVFDVLIGINLLREGLDIPEVTLVAVLDADKEGFLRSERSLIQIIGRAARNNKGTVHLYANLRTPSMERAIQETERRREKQAQYNAQHGITPQTIHKPIAAILPDTNAPETPQANPTVASHAAANRIGLPSFAKIQDKWAYIKKQEKAMRELAKAQRFEEAARIRDQLRKLRTEVE